MRTSLSIRTATVNDIPFLLELDRGTVTAAHWTEQKYLDPFRPSGSGMSSLILVAECGAQMRSTPQGASSHSLTVAGFLVARYLPPEWELENIVVAPTVRRTGIGRQLMDTLVLQARQTNGTAIFLEVRASNSAARRLYEKLGFMETGRRKAYYTNPSEDAVLYSKTLV